jgi:hypothetical protein
MAALRAKAVSNPAAATIPGGGCRDATINGSNGKAVPARQRQSENGPRLIGDASFSRPWKSIGGDDDIVIDPDGNVNATTTMTTMMRPSTDDADTAAPPAKKAKRSNDDLTMRLTSTQPPR